MQQLPVTGARPRSKAIVALQIAERAGWLTFERMEVHGRGDERFYVTLPSGRARMLKRPEVLAWVLGLADAHGAPERVAYREDQLNP